MLEARLKVMRRGVGMLRSMHIGNALVIAFGCAFAGIFDIQAGRLKLRTFGESSFKTLDLFRSSNVKTLLVMPSVIRTKKASW